MKILFLDESNNAIASSIAKRGPIKLLSTIQTNPAHDVDELLDAVFDHADRMMKPGWWAMINDDGWQMFGVLRRLSNGYTFYVPVEYDNGGGSPPIDVKEKIQRWVWDMREKIVFQGVITWKRNANKPTLSIQREQKTKPRVFTPEY